MACDCFGDPRGDKASMLKSPPILHTDVQDTECDAWKRLVDVVEAAADDGRDEFDLKGAVGSDWARIVTLPPTIAKLKSVKRLSLHGSNLVRVPEEIGGMESLEEIDPYTSYRLHWFPYEISRCKNLRKSRVSTRMLYGNYKYRAPFPRLEPSRGSVSLRSCSVCERTFEHTGLHTVWISILVATDVLPLLVHACSETCVASLPKPPDGYVATPHRGGLEVQQPPPADRG